MSASWMEASPDAPSEGGSAQDEGVRRLGDRRDGGRIAVGATIARVAAETLAERYGTPFYIYDLDVVTHRIASLRTALPSRVDIAYAAKANPALAIVAHIGRLGLGVDVASGGELQLAARAGVEASRIVFTGPGKRDEELRRAVRAGIRALTVESPGELERLERIAADERRVVPILLRVASVTVATGERTRIIGDDGAGKFGMDADDLVAVARSAVRSRHLQLLGVHAFAASNVLDAAVIGAHAVATLDVARALAARVGFRVRLVDVGGGLGIAYRHADAELDLVELGRRLAAVLDAADGDPRTAGLRVLLEPGRYAVGPAGAYVARVVDRKRVGARDVVVVDGGIHHVLRPALVGEAHRVQVLGADDRRPSTSPVTVAGALCSGLDVLARDARIPLPDVGDLVAILDAGAYGYTESMPFFLSHPTPAEVAVRAGRPELIRPRLEPEWLLALQRIPEAWLANDPQHPLAAGDLAAPGGAAR